MSPYYVCKMFECVQLSLHITPVKCMTVYSCRVVSNFILRKLLFSLLMYPSPAIRVMNFRVECGPHVAKGCRTERQMTGWSSVMNLKRLETCALLGYSAAYIGNIFSSWIFFPLKMGPIISPETSVRNYHDTLRSVSEERKSHLLRGGSQNSRIEAT